MKNSKIIVLFTEGQTDEVFYKVLYQHFRATNDIYSKLIIKNLKGVGRYEQKAPAKLKHEFIEKFPNSQIIVFCSYDLDVFDIPFQIKPPVDWSRVEKKLLEFGANKVFHIKANKMIEDWFLADIEGLCRFLKIQQPKKLIGKNAFEKMNFLFHKGNKVYQKGYNIGNFIEYLDIVKIYNKYTIEFENLKKELKDE
jgi:hypothetical protein